MNVCVITGQLANNAIVRGKDRKVLVFTVITKTPNVEPENSVSHVPCVVFNPTEELQRVLTMRGKGVAIELQGRVNASRFDPDAEPRSNAEVVVYNKSIKLGAQ